MPNATTHHTASNLFELRRLVCRLIPHLDWRCNGLGVLQAYVLEGEREETRVHVWHPDLEKDGIEVSGKLHDHRFTLQSTVLHGSIGHDVYRLTENPEGDYQAYPVVNARKAMATANTFDGAVTSHEQRYSAEVIRYTMGEGDVYTFKKRAFHGTRVGGLVVTLVSKFEQDDTPARILAPAGSEPVHAFADPLPREVWQPYLNYAERVLGV